MFTALSSRTAGRLCPAGRHCVVQRLCSSRDAESDSGETWELQPICSLNIGKKATNNPRNLGGYRHRSSSTYCTRMTSFRFLHYCFQACSLPLLLAAGHQLLPAECALTETAHGFLLCSWFISRSVLNSRMVLCIWSCGKTKPGPRYHVVIPT